YKHPQATAPDQSCGIYCKGDQWQTLARQADGLADEFVWSLAFDPSDPTGNTMLAGTRSGVIYRSTDRGDNWSATATSFPPGLTVRDVKDIAFQGSRAYAASGAGLLRRGAPADPWTVPMTGDRIARIAVGATGSRRAYAAGEQAIYRSLDTGLTWQSFPVTPQGPYSVVMETTSRDGRHHLWVPDFRRGLYRISTTMAAQPGSSTQAVVLIWSHSPGQPVPSGYELHYGTAPDLLGGTGAQEGSSRILLGSVTSATLTG